MSNYSTLPDEILTLIFLRLPTKTLGRCLRTCKSWNSCITSRAFINFHLNHQTTNNKNCHFFMWHRSHKDRTPGPVLLSLHSVQEKMFVPFKKLEFPKKYRHSFQSDSLEMVGSFDGLICLYNKSIWFGFEIFVWNPTINKLVILPKPPSFFRSDRDQHYYFIGFGFDPKGNDYKVVKITYTDERRSDYKDLPDVELYSLRTRSWRCITNTAPPPNYYVSAKRRPQVYINGIIHWLAHYHSEENICNSLILWFDMSRILFGEMMLPECSSKYLDSRNVFASIAVNDGSLSFSKCDRPYNMCYVWIMKEYGVLNSWTKLFTINFEGSSPIVYDLRTEGAILLSSNEDGIDSPEAKLGLYDPFMEEVRCIEFNGFGCYINLEPWTESLLLLEAWKANSTSLDNGKHQAAIKEKAKERSRARMIHGFAVGGKV